MKRVGVKDFKARLSAFLRMVEAGETIIVTDRGREVAEVRQFGGAASRLSGVERAISEGWLKPASGRGGWGFLKGAGLGLPRGSGSALIDRGREEQDDDAVR